MVEDYLFKRKKMDHLVNNKGRLGFNVVPRRCYPYHKMTSKLTLLVRICAARSGMPDDMKARIQALVDKKIAEEKAAAEAIGKEEPS